MRRWQWLFLGLSGVAVGFATNTHEDMALFGAGFAVFVLMHCRETTSFRDWCRETMPRVCVFCAGAVICYMAVALASGIALLVEMIHGHLAFTATAYSRYESYPWWQVTFRSLLAMFQACFRDKGGATGLIAAVFFTVTLLLTICGFPWRWSRASRLGRLPFVLVLVYLLLHVLLLNNRHVLHQRITLPLLPICLVGLAAWVDGLACRLPRGPVRLIGPFVVVATFVICAHCDMFPRQNRGRLVVNTVRYVHDLVGDKVNGQNVLLVAPAGAYRGDRGFQLDLYFGSNAVYVMDLALPGPYNEDTLEVAVSDLPIRYVFLANTPFVDRRYFDPRQPEHAPFARWASVDTLTAEEDTGIIKSFLRARGAKEIHWKPRHGAMYDLLVEPDSVVGLVVEKESDQ